MFPVLPVVVIALCGAAWHKTSSDKRPVSNGVLTPERQSVYETAMNSTKEPDKLRKLAEIFRANGLGSHATMLEKRAKLRELPPEQKAQRKEIFRKAMSSQNADGILRVAKAFHNDGATGAAEALRKYAESLPPLNPQGTAPQAAPQPLPIQQPVTPPTVQLHGEYNEHGFPESGEIEALTEAEEIEQIPDASDLTEEEPVSESSYGAEENNE